MNRFAPWLRKNRAEPAVEMKGTPTGAPVEEAERVEQGPERRWGEPVTAGPVGRKQVAEATVTLRRYKAAKQALENRIIDNEEWYRLRHWDRIRGRTRRAGDPEPASAWLLNSIANKHADAMDNFPAPNVLPREEGDKQDAEMLSDILPVVLERNDYEQVYSDIWWYKLKQGTGVHGVFWDNRKDNGLGDIAIRKIDLLNLFWEPGISDIQRSRNLFHVELMDNDLLLAQYPTLQGRLGTASLDVAQYVRDESIDTSGKSAVVDWYYKRMDGAKTILHYCKYVNDVVLFASENEPEMAQRGFYDHGQYPFVFDTLFLDEDSPAGFGYIDTMKDPQLYIDKLNQLLLRNAMVAGRTRFFIRSDGAVNEEEYADLSKDFVHVTGSNLGEDSIRQIKVDALDGSFMNLLQAKVEELKETSGNRDFSQGGTTSGVTAASAIAALQEAGSKLSRDMIKGSYRAFRQVNYLCIELIRQFYDLPRHFRIIGENGAARFVEYSNARIQPRDQGQAFGIQLGSRMPIFDIEITAQRSTPFSRVAQNELAKEFYGMGFFNPEMADQALACMDMMDFDGKDTVTQRIAQNGTLFQQVQQLQGQLIKMAQIVDMDRGTNLAQMIAAGATGGMPMPASGGDATGMAVNPLGDAVETSKNTNAGTARDRAMRVSTPE